MGTVVAFSRKNAKVRDQQDQVATIWQVLADAALVGDCGSNVAPSSRERTSGEVPDLN